MSYLLIKLLVNLSQAVIYITTSILLFALSFWTHHSMNRRWVDCIFCTIRFVPYLIAHKCWSWKLWLFKLNPLYCGVILSGISQFVFLSLWKITISFSFFLYWIWYHKHIFSLFLFHSLLRTHVFFSFDFSLCLLVLYCIDFNRHHIVCNLFALKCNNGSVVQLNGTEWIGLDGRKSWRNT